MNWMPNRNGVSRRDSPRTNSPLFDLLKKANLTKAERERIKQSSRDLLAAIKGRLAEA